MALSNKLNIYILVLVFILGLAFLIFNDFGVLKYSRLQKPVDELNVQIKEIEDENKKLQDEIDSLKQKVPAKIEQTAREKYDMIREGEKAYKVK